MRYYKLEKGEPVDCSLADWAEWMAGNNGLRKIARTETAGCIISTVFLGMDRSFGMGGRPQIFETTVFDALSEEEIAVFRCATTPEAMEQHALAVSRAQRGHYTSPKTEPQTPHNDNR